MQGKVDELLLGYLGHLLASGQHALIPAYACRLTAGPRRQIACSLLAHLTLEGSPPARQEAYEQLAQWFAAWAEQGRGDVELDELDIIVRMVPTSLLATGSPLLPASALLQASAW